MIEQADAFAPQAARLLARHGAKATALVADSRKLGMIARLGDDAAEALIRHGGTALPLLDTHGRPGLRALLAVSPQNGRRLAMLHRTGDMQAIGRTDELLKAVARHGDRAMEFVWRNKGALTVSVALAAFLNEPERFLAGTTDLAGMLTKSAVSPLGEIPRNHLTSGWRRSALQLMWIGGVLAAGHALWRRRLKDRSPHRFW